jgi:hypothetical protein
MSAALLALTLAAAPPPEVEMVDPPAPALLEPVYGPPPAPRALGMTAMLLGGVLLSGVALSASSSNDTPLTVLASAGVLSTIGGMMWLVWMQPSEEPKPRGPGYAAGAIGIVHILAGLFTGPLSATTPSRRDGTEIAVLLGSGVAALIAGIAYGVWSYL